MRAAIGILCRHRLGKSALKTIDLLAGVPQAGQFNTGLSHVQACPYRKVRQCDSRSCDVFTQIAGPDIKIFPAQVLEQLRLDKMNLAQVGRRGVLVLEINVLNRDAIMRIAFNPQAFDKRDSVADRLLENVSGGTADRNNLT